MLERWLQKQLSFGRSEGSVGVCKEADAGLLDNDLVKAFGEGVVPVLVREGRLPEA